MKKSLLRNMTMIFKICIITCCFLNVEKTFAQLEPQKCYRDSDGDGFGDPNIFVTASILGCPVGYVDNNFDCDDNDRSINPNTVWYKDADGDGFTTGETLTQCTRPQGYRLKSELFGGNPNISDALSFCNGISYYQRFDNTFDCDDNYTNNEADFSIWLIDNDNDGFVANFTDYYYSCGPRLDGNHYITFNSYCDIKLDCNDNDPLSTTVDQGWYLDADGDGFPLNNTPERFQCQNPGAIYKTRAQLKSLVEDCNDNDNTIFPQVWYEDKDGDGLSTGKSIIACGKPDGYISLPNGPTLIDCDDTNPDATIVQTWYADADGDHHGSPNNLIFSCSRPTGYFAFPELLSVGDCDDNDKDVHPGAIEVCNGKDDNCNGQIDEGFTPQEWVLDKDNDGYYTGDPITACDAPAEGYVLKGSLKPGDCNDNDPAINPETIWYIDNDHDGYYNTSVVYAPSCTPPGPSFNTTSTKGPDCNDNDPAINPATIWYIDNDHDGYYNTSVVYAPSCTPPGPSFNTTSTKGPDCNDNDPAINPETVWVLDADKDGYYTGDPVTQCTSPGQGYVIKFEQHPGDCNDNDPAINPGTIWYLDTDGDGYNNPNTIAFPSCTQPGPNYKLTTRGPDCNDDAIFINPQTNWVLDNDLDGYYVGEPINSCTSPGAGYRIKFNQVAGDCDDNNSSINIPTGWYFDGDKDGYYNQEYVGLPSCTSPGEGWVNSTLGPDCNDGDPAVHTAIQYYVDGDKDGYGSTATVMLCSSVAPVGYSTNNTDCNDADASIHAPVQYYIDNDKDGFGSSATAMLCSSTAPVGYSTNNTDCNDNDKTIYPGAPELCDGKDNNCDGQIDEGGSTLFYRDVDGDGYGTPGNSMQSCSQPTGYVTNNTDCNDNDVNVHSSQTYYLDADKDGYGNPAKTTSACSSTPPAGYVKDNTDCNDNDINVHSSQTYYLDADRDGYGNPAKPITVCSSTQPAGYVKDNTDCNDNDKKVHSGQTYYLDADKDGYGDPAKPITVCSSTQPAGYVNDNTDCNDNDKNIHSAKLFYVDADHDGYGSKTTVLVCSSQAPAGYSTNNSDCDDNNAAVHPGAAEICGNAKDDNCNGQVDEGCTVCQNATALTTTNITTSSAQLNWTAAANPVQWQVDYKKSSSLSWKSLSLSGVVRSINVSSLSSSQTYNWQIKALCGKTWTSYSATQTFRTLSSSQTSSQQSMSVEVVEEGSSTLKLYPNPNNGQFVIQLSVSNEPDGNAKIQMIDVLGRIVHTENASLGSGKLQKTVTMPPQVTRGVYMLRIIVNDKAYQTKLIYQ